MTVSGSKQTGIRPHLGDLDGGFMRIVERQKSCALKSKLLFAALVVVCDLCCTHSVAQSTDQARLCTELILKSTRELKDEQWQALISTAQLYMGMCKEVGTKEDQVETLGEIGLGLTELHQYTDAIPVLRRCVSLDPEATFCWVNLGFSYWQLGKIENARACFY